MLLQPHLYTVLYTDNTHAKTLQQSHFVRISTGVQCLLAHNYQYGTKDLLAVSLQVHLFLNTIAHMMMFAHKDDEERDDEEMEEDEEGEVGDIGDEFEGDDEDALGAGFESEDDEEYDDEEDDDGDLYDEEEE